MEKLAMCRICLVQDVRMYVVVNKNLQELYEKLTNVPFVTEDRRPMLACFFCCTKLKQCCRFLRKCLEAEELFSQMLNEDYERDPLINPGHLKFINGFSNSPIEIISIVGDGQTESDAIKEELPDVSEGLDDIIEPKEEHQTDELKLENVYNNYPVVKDSPVHYAESDPEYDVPLMEIKTEMEAEQESIELKLKNVDNSYLDVKDSPVHYAESDSEYEVPLMEIKDKVEDEQESRDAATEMTHNLLPAKSRKLYDKSYEDFMAWKMQKKATSFSESVLMAYFQELSDKFKSSSLWAKYSMLKRTLSIHNEVDVSKYSNLIAFLKRQSQGYIGKKSKTFSPEQLNKFINEAPSREHLLRKIALIFGIMGACRRQELYNIQFKDVEVYENTILVTVRDKKNRKARSFSITGRYFYLCKEYIALRPTSCKSPCFFLNYHLGKCTKQRVGINKFGTLGKSIADYLKLPNSEQYTGNCFRRTSATLLVDAGGDITTLKRHGGWKPTAVAEVYTDESTTRLTKS